MNCFGMCIIVQNFPVILRGLYFFSGQPFLRGGFGGGGEYWISFKSLKFQAILILNSDLISILFHSFSLLMICILNV